MPAGVGRPPAERFLGRVERLLTETPRSWRTSNEERLAESPPRLRDGERNPEKPGPVVESDVSFGDADRHELPDLMRERLAVAALWSAGFIRVPGGLLLPGAFFWFRGSHQGTRKNIRTREQCPDLLKPCLYSALYVRPQSRWPQRRTGSRRSQTFRNIFSMESGV
jgi:hypothetical protein